MNPIDWLQDNVFYTDAKIKKVEDARKKATRMRSIPSMMTPGQTYGDASYSQQQKTDAINKGVNDFLGVGRPPSTVIGPGGAGGFGLGSNNTVNTPRSEEVVSPTNNNFNNTAEINARLDKEKAAKKAALANTAGNYDHSSGDFGSVLPKETDSLNANNVRQQGRQLSGGVSAAFVPEYANSSFNQMLTTVNKGQFSSNQLSSTVSDPFSGTAPKTQSFNTEAESVTGNSLNDFYYDGNETMLSSRESTGNDTFNPNAARIEGGSSRKPGGSLAEALADKEGINSYMSKFSSGDRQRAANRAFLDTEGSYAGLRAKEAVNGVVYAGGQHHIAGEKSDSAAIGIDRSQARDISNGRSTAQGILEAHIDKNKNKSTGSTPVEAQTPALLEEGAKNGAFKQDKPMFSGSTPAIGGAVEFDNNNSQTLPTFGAPKGYKSQSSYKDPSFPNPFLK